MAGRKRKVNNKAKAVSAVAVVDDDLDDDLDDGVDDDPDAVLSDDDDMDDDGDTLELPSLAELSGAAASASARRRVEDYLEMKRAARELHDLEDFDID
jgi:hypothetical protein